MLKDNINALSLQKRLSILTSRVYKSIGICRVTITKNNEVILHKKGVLFNFNKRKIPLYDFIVHELSTDIAKQLYGTDDWADNIKEEISEVLEKHKMLSIDIKLGYVINHLLKLMDCHSNEYQKLLTKTEDIVSSSEIFTDPISNILYVNEDFDGERKVKRFPRNKFTAIIMDLVENQSTNVQKFGYTIILGLCLNLPRLFGIIPTFDQKIDVKTYSEMELIPTFRVWYNSS